ncbi:MAG: flavin reductase [Pseudomonadota bacterium]
MDTRALRRTLGLFATGVTVVTCRAADGSPTGMTANSFASVSLEPPLVLWSVDREARSFNAFAGAKAFAFSVLAQDQVEISNRFAAPGGEKFGLTQWSTGADDVPLIDHAAAHFECRQHATFDGGDHLIIVGRVERFAAHDRPGLVFAQGRYGAVAPHPGPMPGGEGDIAARDPYDDFLVPLLFRAYSHCFEALSHEFEDAGTSGAEMRVLSVLSRRDGESVDMGEEAVLTRTMLSHTRFADARERLAEAGSIAADGKTLAITAEGQRRLQEFLRAAGSREAASVGDLDPAEVTLLKTLLQRLVRHHENGL